MSNINASVINETFPVAGIDNDSQGFRDNFVNIKNNLTFASTEISDLQTNAILKTQLAGGLAVNNDMNNTLISRALISNFSESTFAFGAVTGAVSVNHINGHYQTVNATGNLIVTFASWPAAGTLGKVRLEITIPTTTAVTVTLPPAVTVGINSIVGNLANVLTFANAPGVYIYEFTSHDGGTVVTINDLTQSRIPRVETVAANRAVNAVVTATIITIAAGIATTYIATPGANISISLAAPSTDGERRRIVFGAGTVVTWTAVAPATTISINKTVFVAGDVIEVIYNSATGAPTNSTATTWYQY